MHHTNDSDEDVDPVLGPVAELMAEHELHSPATPFMSSETKEPVKSLERADRPMQWLDSFNPRLLFKDLFDCVLSALWYRHIRRTYQTDEEPVLSNERQTYSSLKKLCLLFFVSSPSSQPFRRCPFSRVLDLRNSHLFTTADFSWCPSYRYLLTGDR